VSGVLEFTDKIVGLLTMRNPVKQAIRVTALPTVIVLELSLLTET
jgi:hypothetical protein